MGHYHRKSHHKDARRDRVEELRTMELLEEQPIEEEEDGDVLTEG